MAEPEQMTQLVNRDLAQPLEVLTSVRPQPVERVSQPVRRNDRCQSGELSLTEDEVEHGIAEIGICYGNDLGVV
jgi:hypothetical protein